MRPELVSFNLFKGYVSFLYNNHLDEIVKEDINRAKEVKLPLLKLFENLSENEVVEVFKKGIVEYFEQILEGTFFTDIHQKMDEWKADKLPGVPREKVVASDISLAYNVRKHSLINFLPLYTQDLQKALGIVKEIEDFYAYQESLAIQTFADIKNEEEQKLKALIDNSFDFICLSNLKWETIYINKAGQNLLGIDEKEDVKKKKVFEYFPADVQKHIHETVLPIVFEKGHWSGEVEFQHFKTKERISVTWNVFQVIGKNSSQPIGLGFISQDIRERKKNERKLKEREELLSEAQQIAHLGSWEWDPGTNLVTWSDEMYRLFGYDPEEIQMNFDIYMNHINPEDKEMVTSHVYNCYQNQVPYTFENRIIQKDGSTRWLLAKGQVSHKEGGKVLKLSGIAMDITEDKKIEEALKQRSLALEASNKELEAFCYTISHDLRSPLRAIDGFGRKLYMQYGETLEVEGKRLLEVVRTNAKQMGLLIDCLLDFSRLNKKELRSSPLDMESLVKIVLEEYNQQDTDHKAKFIFKDLNSALGDRDLIKQVWHNLISNGIKFSRNVEQPCIEIGSEKRNSQIVYYVKDNGAGFEMEYKDKLFGVFQRLHSGEEFAGTGVGLATVQRIIHRHGGQVWAEGNPGKGATFYFTLSTLKKEIQEKELSL